MSRKRIHLPAVSSLQCSECPVPADDQPLRGQHGGDQDDAGGDRILHGDLLVDPAQGPPGPVMAVLVIDDLIATAAVRPGRPGSAESSRELGRGQVLQLFSRRSSGRGRRRPDSTGWRQLPVRRAASGADTESVRCLEIRTADTGDAEGPATVRWRPFGRSSFRSQAALASPSTLSSGLGAGTSSRSGVFCRRSRYVATVWDQSCRSAT